MSSWQDNTRDPNAQDVKEVVAAAVEAKRQEAVTDRVGYFRDAATGKRVLDVGIVEHTPEAYQAEWWLHRHLKEAASRCLGVDILEQEIAHLRDEGYDVQAHNFEEAPLPGGEEFEVVVLGDVLEHVGNPARFLENLRPSLPNGGEVLVSLPNPWYFVYPLKNLFNRTVYAESVDHVAWHDAHTLHELFSRAGFELTEYRGVRITQVYTAKARLVLKLIPVFLALGFRPELFSKTVIYRFRKVS